MVNSFRDYLSVLVRAQHRSPTSLWSGPALNVQIAAVLLSQAKIIISHSHLLVIRVLWLHLALACENNTAAI